MLRFPTPGAITALSCNDFIAQAWSLIGRKVHKAAVLGDIYAAAQRSIALPVRMDTRAVAMFRLVLEEYLTLGKLRDHVVQQADADLADNPDRRRLMTVPGVGPITALTILAEAGDLRRFAHHRQFLKFCGMSLRPSSPATSVAKADPPSMATLVCALRSGWPLKARCGCGRIACAVNSIVMRANPLDADLRRKAYSAVAAKLARIVYGPIKSGIDYRPFFEEAIPGG